MKRFFRTLAFVAAATFATVSISSCKDDDDDNNSNNKFVFDESRPHGAAVGESTGADMKAFYNGLTNNTKESTIVVDTRSAKEYAAGHVKNAISMPLDNDDAFYYDDDPIYSRIESLDPNHEKFILLTDNGASQMMLHVAGRLSAMGWGKTKIYLLMDKTADFLKQYPDAKE
ncbi:MAG: rhodanese-like domain-containing protein [Paludibacteraceae bacterium]|nr:rhodanese-like domain-containing protein [Paludibacteraceae bacterium]